MSGAKEEFIQLLKSQRLERGDVIFVLQGDGLNRASYAAKLFSEGYAPLVAIVGNAFDRAYGSFPSSEVRDEVVRLGVPSDHILFEEHAPHTRAEADRAMELAREKGWRSMLLVTSPHHQSRAFLTFLKAMKDAGLDVHLVNAVAPLSMSDENPWGKRADLVPQEFAKIATYQTKGDVASFEEGIDYLIST